MIDAIVAALDIVFTPTILFYVLVGSVIGLIFGALPGLGGIVALALLIPITFGMDSTHAIVLFAGAVGGCTFGGSVTAILLNTPGMAPNAATCFDGYPMTRAGRANEALAISATASALGAIFGLIVFIAIIPVVREIILAFRAPEVFWLAILGLSVIAVVSSADVLRGLASGGLGLMVSFIGFNAVTGDYRFGFETNYLWDGIQLIPVLVGIFALGEIINLLVKGGTIAKKASDEGDGLKGGRTIDGIKYVLKNPLALLRSSSIGVLIGMIPGAGGVVASFISYMTAMQSSKQPDRFGNGEPAGVLAVESANDAKDGGALLPTLVFAIPGSALMAVLLSGLILHGVEPGQSLLNDNLDTLFVLVIALIVSNIFTSTIGLVTANQLKKLTYISVEYIIPVVLVVSFAGVFAYRHNINDVYLTVIFGFVGFAMVAFNYSRVAFILGLILGPIAESAFVQTMYVHDGYVGLFTRPIAVLLILITLASLSLPFVRKYRGER